MLLLLATALLFAASRGQHQPSSSAEQECLDFLATNPAEVQNTKFESIRDQESYSKFTNEYQGYTMENHIKFAVHQHNVLYINETRYTTILCVVAEELRADTVMGNKKVASALIYPRRDIPTSIVKVDTECWQNKDRRAISYCAPRYFPMPGLLNTSLFLHPPMTQSFWAGLRDDRTFQKDWLTKVFVKMNVRSMHSSWLQHVSLSRLEQLEVSGPQEGSNELALSPLPRLKVLQLTKGNIQVVPNDLFSVEASSRRMLPLTTLDLSFNNLTTLPTEIFSLLANLESLLLHNNQFEVCPEKAFSHLPNLTYLHLSRNNLSTVPPSCFHQLHRLSILYLSHNNITTLPIKAFKSLLNLVYLDVSHNNLRVFDMNVYEHFQALKSLDLSFNNISTFIMKSNQRNVFNSSARLPQDASSENDINFDLLWESAVHSTPRRLNYLNISHNSLDTLPKNVLLYMDSIETVDIGRNVFNCCHSSTPELKQWLSKPRVFNLNSKNPFTCSLNKPSSRPYVLIKDFTYTEDTCLYSEGDGSSYELQLWLPLALLALIASVIGVLLYTHRYELTYMSHLFKMKKRGEEVDEERYAVCAYDAFVCYSGKDFLWVAQQLLPQLENGPEGYRLCMHDRDFALGAQIDTNIIMSIEKSRKVIIVLTQEFINSKWCQWELEMANHKTFEESRDYVILLELEKLDRRSLPRHLRYLMDTRTYLEWPQGKDERRVTQAWRRLREALGESIEQRTGKKPVQNRTVLDP